MIFVTVGTNEAQFDRILRAVAGLRTDERLVIQHGHTSPVDVPQADLVDFLSFEEMNETIRRARVVVTHAGVGSVMVALANAKRPIVVPRRKAFGEAVDDHQLQLGRRFADADLVTLVESPQDLAEAVEREQEAAKVVADSSSLAADLRSFLEGAIGSGQLAQT
jgi:UDP-N-acetylglucosamine transferase subunit ALG13